MSDASTAGATIALPAAAAIAAVPGGGALTDLQILLLTFAIGLAGGLLATLSMKDEITRREMTLRCLTSGLLVPALVFLALAHWALQPTLLHVCVMAGPAGLIAWPVWAGVRDFVIAKIVKALTAAFGGGDGT